MYACFDAVGLRLGACRAAGGEASVFPHGRKGMTPRGRKGTIPHGRRCTAPHNENAATVVAAFRWKSFGCDYLPGFQLDSAFLA